MSIKDTPIFFFVKRDGKTSRKIKLSGEIDGESIKYVLRIFTRESQTLALCNKYELKGSNGSLAFLPLYAANNINDDSTFGVYEGPTNEMYMFNYHGKLLGTIDIDKIDPLKKDQYYVSPYFINIAGNIVMIRGKIFDDCSKRALLFINIDSKKKCKFKLRNCKNLFFPSDASMQYNAVNNMLYVARFRGYSGSEDSIRGYIGVFDLEGRMRASFGKYESHGIYIPSGYDALYFDIDSDGNSYSVPSVLVDSIYVYDKSFKEIKSFPLNLFYRTPFKKISKKEASNAKKVRDWQYRNTVIRNVLIGGDGRIYVQYVTNIKGEKEYYLAIYDRDGNKYNEEVNMSEYIFYVNKDSEIYALWPIKDKFFLFKYCWKN